jgi:hypothetical protein
MLVSIIIAVSLVAGAHSACTGGGTSGGTCDQAAAMLAYVDCADNSDCTQAGTVCSQYPVYYDCEYYSIPATTQSSLFLHFFH